MAKLTIQDCCNLAEAHDNFDAMLSENVFWRHVVLDDDRECTNAVCHYVFEHSALVSEILIDNVGSSEATFITLWTDIMLAAMTNARKVTVVHSTFLTNGLFVTAIPLITELRLQSCPNLNAFTLSQGFCVRAPLHSKLSMSPESWG